MRRADLGRLAAAAGVPPRQLQRDETISHVLHALPDVLDEDVVFFGGTSLCRTYLPGHRYSEDIDLLVDRATAARDQLSGRLPTALRKQFPTATVDWEQDRDTWQGTLRSGSGPGIRIQLVRSDAVYRRYPTRREPVALYYDGLPESIAIRVPTPAGAAGMKLSAWCDRKAARDLCDLGALQARGMLSEEALSLAHGANHGVGPTGFGSDAMPSEVEWKAALDQQMRQPPNRELTFHNVRSHVAGLGNWPQANRWEKEADRYRANVELEELILDAQQVSSEGLVAATSERCSSMATVSGIPCRNPAATCPHH